MTSRTPLRLLFDATRLLSRARYSTPTGIDRVDLSYAQALLATPGFDTRLMAFDALGPYCIGPAAAERLLEETACRWQTTTARRSKAFAQLTVWLQSAIDQSSPVIRMQTEFTGPDLSAIGRLRYRGRTPGGANDERSIYVNTSHGRLFQASVVRWLKRQQSPGVFFVHDLIPIEHPEFNRAREAARHALRLRLIAGQAQLVIVNSESTRAALQAWWKAERLPQPTIVVIPLGVADVFCGGPSVQRSPSGPPPYFVVLGTIEPRKNHALLLQLWRRLAEQDGARAPRLLVIGRRGWENETTFNLLDRMSCLRPLVAEASGLSDGEIAELLRGACALLAPSFAEGYGLPVAEALAVGTPVIASDIPAHREVGGSWIHVLDPLDGPAWLDAIRRYAAFDSVERRERVAALPDYRAPSWQAHAGAAVAAIREAFAGSRNFGSG